MYITPDSISDKLYVITSIFNPIRYKSRWKHYERFAEHVKHSGGILYTIEAAFGERDFSLAAKDCERKVRISEKAAETAPHKYIQVRTDDEVWVKENLLNIALACLPADAKYVAFVDADVQFARPNWVGETIHQLQHYKVVQMFSHAMDLGPHYNALQMHEGFAFDYATGVKKPDNTLGYYYYTTPGKRGKPNQWHPGFAWAWRREALDMVGRLVDYAILGSADKHMAHGLIGDIASTLHPELSEEYKNKLLEWEFQAERFVRRNVGFVSGLLLHYWHGNKKDRKYRDRWKILTDHKYDPNTDIKYDWQGVLQLNDRGDERSIKLRDEIKVYFSQRNEDDIPTIDLI